MVLDPAQTYAQGGPIQLTVGVTDQGMYGNKWGSDEHETELIATFQSQGTDLDLLATGYDMELPPAKRM